MPLVVAERSDVGGSSAARVRLLGSRCTSRSFGPRAPGVDASAARAAARRSVRFPRTGWTFDGHRLPRPPSVDPRARRVDPATGRGHAVERGLPPHAAPRWRPGPPQTDDRPRRGTWTGCRMPRPRRPTRPTAWNPTTLAASAPAPTFCATSTRSPIEMAATRRPMSFTTGTRLT